MAPLRAFAGKPRSYRFSGLNDTNPVGARLAREAFKGLKAPVSKAFRDL
jgi:hypothetical protein